MSIIRSTLHGAHHEFHDLSQFLSTGHELRHQFHKFRSTRHTVLDDRSLVDTSQTSESFDALTTFQFRGQLIFIYSSMCIDLLSLVTSVESISTSDMTSKRTAHRVFDSSPHLHSLARQEHALAVFVELVVQHVSDL